MCKWWLQFYYDKYIFSLDFPLTFITLFSNLAPVDAKITKVQKDIKNESKIWLRNGTKNKNIFFAHASRSLLCIRFVAVSFGSEEEVFWRRGPPVTYFDPILGSGRKTTIVRDHEYFIPTKFRKYPSSGSVVGWLSVPIHKHALMQSPPLPSPK